MGAQVWSASARECIEPSVTAVIAFLRARENSDEEAAKGRRKGAEPRQTEEMSRSLRAV